MSVKRRWSSGARPLVQEDVRCVVSPPGEPAGPVWGTVKVDGQPHCNGTAHGSVLYRPNAKYPAGRSGLSTGRGEAVLPCVLGVSWDTARPLPDHARRCPLTMSTVEAVWPRWHRRPLGSGCGLRAASTA